MEKRSQEHIAAPELTTLKREKRKGMQTILTEAETLGKGLGWEGKLIIVKQQLKESYGEDYMKEGAAAKLVSMCEAEIEFEKLGRELVLRREEIISIYPEAANSPFFTNDGPSAVSVKENEDKNYLVDNRRAAA